MLDNLVFAVQERAAHLPDKGAALQQAIEGTKTSYATTVLTGRTKPNISPPNPS
ncbi:MAG: hypothetical protein KGI29_09900 [Pseudomonadota bacterium]|nr:hypothetical protein [Pseudomonadota bacterium]MDE3038733.1 hypothetical protein [Pseudomonadota bacterium]